MAESGNAPVLSFRTSRADGKMMRNRQTGACKGFRVQIPTLANSEFAGRMRFESIEPTKQDFSKQAVIGCEFKLFSRQLEKYSMSIPQSQLEELRSILHHVDKKRFKGKRKIPKYGSINKGFTELELQHFLRNVPNEKFRLLFKYQAYLGLRVGEVSRLHISNIDFDKRELTIKSEKSAVSDSLAIPLELFKETIEFINQNISAIQKSKGYIFFKDNDNNHNNLSHVDANYVRKVFRASIKISGSDQIYDYSEETYAHHRARPLHRLTTHSLRHYAITKFAKSTNGNIVLVSRFARHSNPMITMRYIAKDNDQLYKEIDNAFSTNQVKNLRNNFSKIM